MQQPSESEIQRELEALRDIRRRSSSQGGPGALILDPDLPTPQPAAGSSLSAQGRQWAAGSSPSSPTGTSGEASDAVDEDAVLNDPFHLFWVPAQAHPEINPNEFRNFLKEHAHAPEEGAGAILSRINSASSSLGRKRSMLSRQYKPRENDSVEEEHVIPLQRNRSIYTNGGPQLTISDLQKLDQLAEEASKSDDPTRLRSLLRRSLSLNVPPTSIIDQIDDMPDPGEDADAPIIVPRPNQILRRAARTKIRKPGLVGDGGGHRFGPSSRRRSGGRAMTDDGHVPSDRSSSDHGDREKRSDETEEEYLTNRRLTYSEETSIYDAYATDEPEEFVKPVSPPPMPTVLQLLPLEKVSPPELKKPESEPVSEPVIPVLYQPQPKRHLAPPTEQVLQVPSRTPSPPEAVSVSPSPGDLRRVASPASDLSSIRTTSPGPSELRKEKEKDKKGLLTKWGGKTSKKATKDQKDSGFFGSLFGGSKKKQEEQPTQPFSPGGSGRAAAAALLGESKSSKSYQPPPSPQLANAWARYPIHVERAVYRLSHIKLANPRRPLYEQVLISNLMFWYLGVINRSPQGPGQSQNPQQPQQASPPTSPPAQTQPAEGMPQNASIEKEHMEGQKEREEKERLEKEKMEKEKQERDREMEKVEQRKEARRGGLTKSPPQGAGSGRRAEMPVRAPQYGLQHQVIDQEYDPGFTPGPAPIVRTSSAPPPTMSPPAFSGGYPVRPPVQPLKQPVSVAQAPNVHQQPRHPQQPNQYPHNQYSHQHTHHQSQPQFPPQNFARPGAPEIQRSASPGRPSAGPGHLPPGAMPPLDNSWSGQPIARGPLSAPARTTSPPHHTPDMTGYNQRHQARTSRSPPPHHYQNHDGSKSSPPPGARIPTRSLSATASPVLPPSAIHQNGVLKKKPASAIAAAPSDWNARHREAPPASGEEEDVPLALWQQQQHRRR